MNLLYGCEDLWQGAGQVLRCPLALKSLKIFSKLSSHFEKYKIVKNMTFMTALNQITLL